MAHSLENPWTSAHWAPLSNFQARIPEWVARDPTQGSSPRLLHRQADSLPLNHLGGPSVSISASQILMCTVITSGFCEKQVQIRDVLGETSYSTFLTRSVSSVAQSCLILCDSMDFSMPGLPVHYQLSKLA